MSYRSFPSVSAHHHSPQALPWTRCIAAAGSVGEVDDKSGRSTDHVKNLQLCALACAAVLEVRCNSECMRMVIQCCLLRIITHAMSSCYLYGRPTQGLALLPVQLLSPPGVLAQLVCPMFATGALGQTDLLEALPLLNSIDAPIQVSAT